MRDRAKQSMGARYKQKWTFVGRSTWQEESGVIYSPLYANPLFDRRDKSPSSYADYSVYVDHPEMDRRWEYAYPTTHMYSDIDAAITFEQRYTSGAGCGIVLRAMDSVRHYTVEVTDMGRKGHDYRVALCVHDASGYRTEIACGYAPHSVMAEDFLHGRIKDRQMWEQSSPDPATLRVKAQGSRISAFLDGKEIFCVNDTTYSAGATGIFAGLATAVTILEYTLVATPAPQTPEPWREVDIRGFCFFPVPRGAVGGYFSWPLMTSSRAGEIIVSFAQGQARSVAQFGCEGVEGLAFTTSDDDGRTWSRPRIAYRREGYNVGGSIYAHEDGSWTLIATENRPGPVEQTPESRIVRLKSTDRGQNWSQPSELLFGGQPASGFGWKGFYLHSPISRLSDGTLIITAYRVEVASGAKTVDNTTRRDQSFVVRSTDDAETWSAPILIDTSEFDTNECMLGEPEAGRLVAFSRTLRGRTMWTATSEDGGLHWSDLQQSNVAGECPFLLTHSSGALVLATRSTGVSISFDGGVSWTKPRILTVDGMMSMVELSDARVLIAGHLGWANPTYITADIFRVTHEGPQAARNS